VNGANQKAGPVSWCWGTRGLNGGALAALLDEMGAIDVVRGARNPQIVAAWKDAGKTAVRIDLDDPMSFPKRWPGSTGYS
jgi:hypothetical protein